MRQIELRQLPNQSFTLTLSNNVYDLTLRTVNTNSAQIMACDLSINNNFVVRGQRLVAGFPIIPYEYLENGSFVIVTNDDELPDYRNFQISQFLIFASSAEIEAINAGTFNE